MVNQLSKFSDHLADKTKSIRELLQKGNQWTWGNAQQKAFEQIKTDLTRAPVLALYDPNKETKVAADASSHRLGGVVLQLQPDNSMRPVSFLSRALTPTRIKLCTDRKRWSGTDFGLREIMGIHHWKVDLCGNGPQVFGPTVEHTLTTRVSG